MRGHNNYSRIGYCDFRMAVREGYRDDEDLLHNVCLVGHCDECSCCFVDVKGKSVEYKHIPVSIYREW